MKQSLPNSGETPSTGRMVAMAKVFSYTNILLYRRISVFLKGTNQRSVRTCPYNVFLASD
jgi:hypothetical protein